MNATVYTAAGTKSGDITLRDMIFNARWNPDLVHQVVVSIQGNARAGTAHSKDRSEVSGGGKKPWRQKGTGRARHGSRRSPIWTGGGVTFGPRNERDYSRKVNRKMRSKALASVLSRKYADGEVLFLESLSFNAPKTKDVKTLLTVVAKAAGVARLATKRVNNVLFVLPERDEAFEKSVRNFGNIDVVQAKDLNPLHVLTYTHVVVVSPDAVQAILETRIEGRPVAETTA